MALTVLAMYDVRDDQRRARVAAVLQRWGDRIQRSVFICSIPSEDLPGVVKDVEQIIDSDTDSFLVTRQCGICWDGHIRLGQAEPRPPALCWTAL